MFELDEVALKFPTDYNESMNTVLTQEALKYNRLIKIMKVQLVDIQKALVGEVVMSEDLDAMGTSLFDNQVPLLWATKGFLSLKPLGSWMMDLLERISFLTKWIEKGSPPAFWISGFFFPQAFFTATLQNYARKHIIAIDELKFDFKIIDEYSLNEITEKPDDGCYIYGMFMEGARWNSTTHLLDDSNPKQLYTEMPIVWFIPKKNRVTPVDGIYMCPIYKVLSRSGTLSTTGHSTNYCLMIELPSNREQDEWIRAGVALFLALRY
jgi:dynein heavy chain